MLNIVGVISLCVEFLIIFFLIREILKTGRFISSKRISFVIPAFLNILFLYYVALFYSEHSILNSLLYAVQYAVLAFAFRFNFDIIANSLSSISIFYVAFYIGIGIVMLTTVMVVISLAFGKIVNSLKTKFLMNKSIIIIGFNNDALLFYNSIKSNAKYFIIENDQDIIKFFLKENIKYFIKNDNIYRTLAKKNKSIEFISFLDNQDEQIKLIEEFKYLYNNITTNFKLKVLANHERYLFLIGLVNENYPIIILDLNDLIVKKLFLERQITTYLKDFIDYDNGTLNNDTSINIIFLGFDENNLKIYEYSLLNNQYVKLTNDGYKAYTPTYFIYNNGEKIANLELNYSLRHIDEIKDQRLYFPLPEKIEETHFIDTTFNDLDFFTNLKTKLNSSYNIIYISTNNEDLNLNLTYKIKQKLLEWNKLTNSKIFTKINDDCLLNVKELESDNIILYGAKKEVLTYPIVVSGFLDEYAKRRALYYELTNQGLDIKTINELFTKNDQNTMIKKELLWDKLSEYQKMSNISSVFNIDTKLMMLGLKITPDKSKAISKEEYLNIYDDFGKLKEKEIVYYDRSSSKKPISKRDALAYMEHLRWNAFMITYGYIPMEKSLIRVDVIDGKIKLYKNDVTKRLHACITTDEGLEEYFKFMSNLIVKHTNKTYDEAFKMVENKCYDYMLMDTIFDDITLMGLYIKKI